MIPKTAFLVSTGMTVPSTTRSKPSSSTADQHSGVTAPATVHDLHGMLDEMRVFKDDTEVARLLQAAMNEMAENGELKAIFARHGVQVVRP